MFVKPFLQKYANFSKGVQKVYCRNDTVVLRHLQRCLFTQHIEERVTASCFYYLKQPYFIRFISIVLLSYLHNQMHTHGCEASSSQL